MKGGGHGNKKRRTAAAAAAREGLVQKANRITPKIAHPTLSQTTGRAGEFRRIQPTNGVPSTSSSGGRAPKTKTNRRRLRFVADSSSRIVVEPTTLAALPTSCKGARLRGSTCTPPRALQRRKRTWLSAESHASHEVRRPLAWKTRADSGRGWTCGKFTTTSWGLGGTQRTASGTGSAAVRPAGQRHWDVA